MSIKLSKESGFNNPIEASEASYAFHVFLSK